MKYQFIAAGKRILETKSIPIIDWLSVIPWI